MMYVIGFDAGTTTFKAGLYDENLKPVCFRFKEYKLSYCGEGIVEYSPEAYFEMFCELIREIVAQSAVGPDKIAAISISCQGETLILTDKNRKPLCNAVVWTDCRATDQARQIKADFGTEQIFEFTGQREITGSWPASKILWFKQCRPDIFDQADKFLLLEDYLVYRLTGIAATDKSISSSTLLCDIRAGRWWDKMLDYIGITEDRLPLLRESGETISCLTQEACELTGLASGTLMVSGALDQAAGMLGAGNTRPGIVSETTGTCLSVCTQLDGLSGNVRHGKLPVHYSFKKNTYYAIYWSAAAGSILEWLKKLLYCDIRDDIYKTIDKEAGNINPGCDGLTILPYFSGMNYPATDETARGSIIGLTLAHSRGHLARAAMESIAFLLQQSIGEFQSYGINVDEIISMGGAAKSDFWTQLKADVTGKRIRVPGDSETACLGAAILAFRGLGADKTPDTQNRFVLPSNDYSAIYNRFEVENKRYLNLKLKED